MPDWGHAQCIRGFVLTIWFEEVAVEIIGGLQGRQCCCAFIVLPYFEPLVIVIALCIEFIELFAECVTQSSAVQSADNYAAESEQAETDDLMCDAFELFAFKYFW